jgi:hypothetical protein
MSVAENKRTFAQLKKMKSLNYKICDGAYRPQNLEYLEIDDHGKKLVKHLDSIVANPGNIPAEDQETLQKAATNLCDNLAKRTERLPQETRTLPMKIVHASTILEEHPHSVKYGLNTYRLKRPSDASTTLDKSESGLPSYDDYMGR